MTPIDIEAVDFSQLTAAQRIALIGRIWDSIAEDEFQVPESHKQLIRQRLAQREANPGTDRPWEEVKREIQAERRADVDRG